MFQIGSCFHIAVFLDDKSTRVFVIRGSSYIALHILSVAHPLANQSLCNLPEGGSS